jgi:hypothetical protein
LSEEVDRNWSGFRDVKMIVSEGRDYGWVGLSRPYRLTVEEIIVPSNIYDVDEDMKRAIIQYTSIYLNPLS